MQTKFSLIVVLLLCLSCANKSEDKSQKASVNKTVTNTEEPQTFNSYWYSGKAEISSYELSQSRYGTLRKGEVVLIFVTEPFSLSKHVKLDRPKQAGSDKVTVMKLNNVRKFNTGIYDYSILTSTFTPINFKDHPYTLKSTTTVQEWCGQTFTQLNLVENGYQFKQFSYFESEGDQEKTLDLALLEEDILTRIRIQKGQLEPGEITLIPSTIYSRFTHKKMQAEAATLSKSTTENEIVYTISYKTIDRTLTIEVEKEFPYKIMGWTEDNGDGLQSKAILKASMLEPYWQQKSVEDEAKRDRLKLIK